MASIKQLKKKINQQSFKILDAALRGSGNQKGKTENLVTVLEEVRYFQQISIKRINGSCKLMRAERRAEIKSVAEQLKDKETFFLKSISI